jgi:hypothetical protein
MLAVLISMPNEGKRAVRKVRNRNASNYSLFIFSNA